MRAPLRSLLALSLTLPTSGTQAISLGEIEANSRLGEPLHASIPVALDEDILPRNECFKLAESSRRHPDLIDAQLALASKGKGHRLFITTTGLIEDPILELTLQVEDCGPFLQREYVLLLSPRAVEGKAAKAVKAAAQTLPAAGVPLATSHAIQGGAPPNASRHLLRMDYSFESLAGVGRPWAKTRPKAPRIRSASATQAQPKFLRIEPLPPVADIAKPMPDTMEGRAPTAAMEQEAQPLAKLPPQPEVIARAVTEPQPLPGMEPPAVPASPAAQDTGSSGNVFLYLPFFGLLILLAASVAWWLKSRGSTEQMRSKSELPAQAPVLTQWDDTPPTGDASQDEMDYKVSPTALEVMHFDRVEQRPSATERRVRETNTPIDWDAETLLSGPALSGAPDWQAETLEHIIELAEVMLAFGRSGQAMETLSKYIGDNPRQAVDPWLKLLDLYHQSGLREEYESLSSELHKHFNVAIPGWDEFSADRQPPPGHLSLESLPHILARIVSTWGSRDGLTYLEHLLSDNRDGKRLGFTLPIVREIMLLRDILRQYDQPADKPTVSRGR